MEDMLAVDTRPYDPLRPQVWLDETSRQLLGEVTPSLPPAPGRPAREDYEYVRQGVQPVPGGEPLAGWRQVMVSARRTRIDWASCSRDLVDVHYPDAEQIVLVHDNLNTHTRRRCTRRSRRPRPSGWPTGWSCTTPPSTAAGCSMAEIELAMLAGQCLDRRLANQPILEREVAAWQAARNRAGRGVNWRFTTEDARIKLKHLYPTTQG
jgi:hypothetical protein